MLRRLLLLLAVPAALAADVRLPALLDDHAILQRDLPIHIWGWAEPGEAVYVSFRSQTGETTATSDGRFSVYLQPESAGGPHALTIQGQNRIVLEDILVGEVWVGSGQSNMVWTVERSNNKEEEIAAADYPEIRIFKVALETSDTEKEDVDGSWAAVTPETIPSFSAVGYFFARHLHRELGVPFGVIQSAWGGTPAESWTTSETLMADPALREYLAAWDEVVAAHPREYARYQARLAQWKVNKQGRAPGAPRGPGHHHQPASLFNAMIAPLTPYGIRGVIWYQGENNGNRGQGYQYRRLFKSMILDWRRRWGLGDMPFFWVQLANYARVPEIAQWPELREAQSMALSLRNTAEAVTIDIGESEDIHPTNKQDVGLRLALAARAVTYGDKNVVYSGPRFRQMTTEGGKARLWFDHVGGGLSLKDGSAGFEVAGPDGVFHTATVKIDGRSLLVSSENVQRPSAVRYAWAADPKVTLFNKEGLPASPFRTDEWK